MGKHSGIAVVALMAIAMAMPVCGSAQNGFNDSLVQVSRRIAAMLGAADKQRVAVAEVSEPAGTLSGNVLTYVEEVLIMRLTEQPGITVVERRGLDQVLEEQRRTASGTFDEGTAIELGRLLAADAIITGRVFNVDQRMHLMFRVLDTGTGVLLGTAETFTAFPRGKEPGRAAPPPSREPQQPLRLKRDGPGSERTSILEGRVAAVGGQHLSRGILGGTVEFGVRSREESGGSLVPGRFGIGIQAGFWPGVAMARQPSLDVGHIKQLDFTPGFAGAQTVRFGSTEMGQGRLFLMPQGADQVLLQTIGSNGQGTQRVIYERHSLSNIRMDMVGLNIPVRWYLGQNHIYDNVPKLYAEFGFGMDMVSVRADYRVSTTRVEWVGPGADDYDVGTTTLQFKEPALGSTGSEIWFTHFTFGGGVEFGRFNLFAQGRWFAATTFRQPGSEFQRVRGNITAFPFLVGADQDARVQGEVLSNGAVPYGAMDLERITGGDTPGGGTTVTGNGVDRLWQRGYFLFGLSFRFL